MPKYIAFLRAISPVRVGKMERLKKLFEELGFANVETFISSGNVIFDSPSKNVRLLEERIEGHIEKSLGFESTTFIRTPAEVAAVARHNPFPDSEVNAKGTTLFVYFLADKPGEAAKKKLLSFNSKGNQFHVRGREVYWLCRTRFMESDFSGGRLEKILEMPATFRTSGTVKKLVEKYG
ncbi:MAG: DUF1697 domain-containing protein [candidate division Zixibacteria bacterium]|nr:DUF1697 domain-containing protein [candidate division Zixibacteria bacterium]